MSDRAPYDYIAAVYDRLWGEVFAAVARSAIASHLLRRLPPGAPVLDLCCGTGLIAGHLDSLGFQVSGVDESARMLEIARVNAPRARFQQADMARFRYPEPFDAVVSFYNSINHARSAAHLRRTIANVAAHLRPKGLFLFDYVGPEGFEDDWESSEQFDDENRVWSLDYRYEPATGRACCVVNGRETIPQNAFGAGKIRLALDAAGFVVLDEGPLTDARPPAARTLVLAGKQ
jgi:SAM-dependent methyltransferase